MVATPASWVAVASGVPAVVASSLVYAGGLLGGASGSGGGGGVSLEGESPLVSRVSKSVYCSFLRVVKMSRDLWRW